MHVVKGGIDHVIFFFCEINCDPISTALTHCQAETTIFVTILMSIYRYTSTHPPQLDMSNNQKKGHHHNLGTSQGTLTHHKKGPKDQIPLLLVF